MICETGKVERGNEKMEKEIGVWWHESVKSLPKFSDKTKKKGSPNSESLTFNRILKNHFPFRISTSPLKLEKEYSGPPPPMVP